MVKSSHKSSFCGLMGLVPAWAQVAVIVLIAASLFLAGAKLNVSAGPRKLPRMIERGRLR